MIYSIKASGFKIDGEWIGEGGRGGDWFRSVSSPAGLPAGGGDEGMREARYRSGPGVRGP